MERKTANTGAFANLPVPMQLREVRRIAKKYDIDLTGLTIKIQRDEELLRLRKTGCADHSCIGRIDLFPLAFANEREVASTLVHEIAHVNQYREHGSAEVMDNFSRFEEEAEAIEEMFNSCYWDGGKADDLD